jgi:hypothetical protein
VRIRVKSIRPGSGDPTGQVIITENGTQLGVSRLVNGDASVRLSDVAPGEHTYVVNYLGDSNYVPSSTQMTLTFPSSRQTYRL